MNHNFALLIAIIKPSSSTHYRIEVTRFGIRFFFCDLSIDKSNRFLNGSILCLYKQNIERIYSFNSRTQYAPQATTTKTILLNYLTWNDILNRMEFRIKYNLRQFTRIAYQNCQWPWRYVWLFCSSQNK